MRHKLISITDKNARMVYTYSGGENGDNRDDIRRMSELLRRAMNSGLTDRQRYCMNEYYINEKSMKNIAAELGVYPSTVTRHIQSAKKKLKDITRYYQ